MVPLPHKIAEREYVREVEEGEDLQRAIEESTTLYQRELWLRHYREHYDDELVDHDGDEDLSIGSAPSEGDADADADVDNDDIEMSSSLVVNVSSNDDALVRRIPGPPVMGFV